MSVSRPLLLALALAATLVSGQRRNGNDCPSDSVSFEIVTGYVYTAPADMLDSQPGSLMLTDCIDTCARNSSCQAINYETGLCVMFSSSADQSNGEERCIERIRLLVSSCVPLHCDRLLSVLN